jgi:rod shape-determining protein MreB
MGATDIGIDLGTSNIVMAVGKKGVVLSEPSAIAYNSKSKKVVAVGKEAYNMIGKTPEYIDVVKPLSNGVISDDEMTQCLIKEFIFKVTGRQLVKPRIVICVPAFITDVEKRAVVDAAMSAGSRKAYLIDEPIAAMIGAGVDISKATGHMVVDIGGGTTDVAIVSMNGLVTSRSIKTAGNRIDEAIIRYVQSKYKLLIGQQTAEKIKINHTNLYDPTSEKKFPVRGRNLLRGLPEQIMMSENELFTAMENEIFEILENIRQVLEETPPELVGDIYENGVLLTGGGSLLGGFKELMRRTLGIKGVLADDPLNCVAKGTVIAFRKINNLLEGMENIAVYQYQY